MSCDCGLFITSQHSVCWTVSASNCKLLANAVYGTLRSVRISYFLWENVNELRMLVRGHRSHDFQAFGFIWPHNYEKLSCTEDCMLGTPDLTRV